MMTWIGEREATHEPILIDPQLVAIWKIYLMTLQPRQRLVPYSTKRTAKEEFHRTLSILLFRFPHATSDDKPEEFLNANSVRERDEYELRGEKEISVTVAGFLVSL